MTKKLAILGSTGSIGRQTLDVVSHMDVEVVALTASTNVARMVEQCHQVRPKLAVMQDEMAAAAVRTQVEDLGITVLSGMEGLMIAATMEAADTVLTAVVGMVGLRPTLAAIQAGKRIALANKETLVCGGDLVMAAAKQYGAQILPVDSEHSAIFQCLMGNETKAVKRLILTASGGPFFGMERENIGKMTRHDALKHPNWTMGEKITIDCATLMNKGLEVMEAMHLYGMPAEQVDVVVHRQSIIHSMVEYVDGAVMAQMGAPDMRLPIQLALTYPHRVDGNLPTLDLLTCGDLTFHKPDLEKFPCLKLALDVAKQGGNAGAILNGANEVAVSLFLQEKIGFYDISDLVSKALDTVPWIANPTLEQILESDRLARQAVL